MSENASQHEITGLLSALRHGEGRVRLAAVADNGEILLTVRDEGPGFPDGFAEEAFERFSRADQGRTGGGSGLGLAIVRAVAAAHGGHAEANGAGVTLTLPA